MEGQHTPPNTTDPIQQDAAVTGTPLARGLAADAEFSKTFR